MNDERDGDHHSSGYVETLKAILDAPRVPGRDATIEERYNYLVKRNAILTRALLDVAAKLDESRAQTRQVAFDLGQLQTQMGHRATA